MSIWGKRKCEDFKMANQKRDYEDYEYLLNEFEPSEAEIIKKGDGHRKPPKKKGFKEKWKSLKTWKKALIIIAAVLVLLILIAYLVVFGIYNGFRTQLNEKDLGISSDIKDKYGDTDIFNVAIFGVDTRNEDSFKGLSDTIMIVSIDAKNRSVKIVSILRDSRVAIEGHGNEKITHAYSYGGAPLAIKTINQNFNMNITDYATINMFKLSDAINILGGIDIEITESERDQINAEALYGDPKAQRGAALVNDYGKVHLDGDQATIFCRLRHMDSDEARSNRQKMVINALLEQAKKVSPTKYAEVVRTMMSLCETSVSFSEVMKFVPLINEKVSIEAITVPGEPENAIGGIYEGYWVWRYDLQQAAERIHLFLYGEPANGSTSYNSSYDLTTATTTRVAVTSNSKYDEDDDDNGYSGETTTKGRKNNSSQNETTTAAQEVTEAPTNDHEELTYPPEPVTEAPVTTPPEPVTSSWDEAA